MPKLSKFKVVLVGDQNVGKTSVISRFIQDSFEPTANVPNTIISANRRNRFCDQDYANRRLNITSSIMGYSRSIEI